MVYYFIMATFKLPNKFIKYPTIILICFAIIFSFTFVSESYGISTLDDDHKNHDHSINNESHANVQVSNEATSRIGDAPDTDVHDHHLNEAIVHDSANAPSKTDDHGIILPVHIEDFADHSYMTGIISWLTVFLGLIGIVLIISRLASSPSCQPRLTGSEGFDLMKIKWLRSLITSKYFRLLFIIPTLLIFLAVIYYGFFDVQDGQRNIATVFTWTLWWSLIIFSLILVGRFWCMMCPFAFMGDLAQKIVSLNKKLPHWLQNMGFQTVGFILLTWAFTIMSFGSRPFLTSVIMVIILLAAVVFSMIYKRRSFCRYICPIGAVIGIYSMVSPIELRSNSKGRCNIHKRKTCKEACPMLESPENMDNNIYCNFCMKCEPVCPSHNISLRIRSFGKDIYTSVHKSPAEAIAALFILSVVIVETLAMTSVWEPLKHGFSSSSGITAPSLVYTVVFTAVLLIPAAFFYMICYLLKLWLGKNEYKTHDLVKDFAFIFIPLGVGLHFAHNIQHFLTESPIAIPATIRFLQNIGIGTSLSINWNTSPILGSQSIFFIQMGILTGGFTFTLYVLYRLLKRFQKPIYHAYKMTLAMSLYAIVIALSAIYMLGLPMGGRHVH